MLLQFNFAYKYLNKENLKSDISKGFMLKRQLIKEY